MNPVDKEIKDLTRDGQVSEEEFLFQPQLIKEEAQVENDKLRAQQYIAFISLGSLILFTLILMTPIISIPRVNALEPIFQLLIFTMSSLCGVFMGLQGMQQLRKK